MDLLGLGVCTPPPTRKYQGLPMDSSLWRKYGKVLKIAGWEEEERSGPTGKSFRFVRACVRAVIVKWK